ncbi:MAG TPA: methyltransferase domain-containing protein [Gemmatimonadaceae bacterium]|nr:methyltransferase domain-containing protein [Gemmatimonadaceae bacterium]
MTERADGFQVSFRHSWIGRALRLFFPYGALIPRLRGLRPVSDHWGFDRGQPVDRYYLDRFIRENGRDVRGRVLEVGAPRYADAYRAEIARLDVLDVDSANRGATILGDLSDVRTLPNDTFDCILLTQVLQSLEVPVTGLVNAGRAIRPGGVLLASVPAISRIPPEGTGTTWYTSFTEPGVRKLCTTALPGFNVTIKAHGNLAVATAFLEGRAAEELPQSILEYRDAEYPIIITIRAERPAAS